MVHRLSFDTILSDDVLGNVLSWDYGSSEHIRILKNFKIKLSFRFWKSVGRMKH